MTEDAASTPLRILLVPARAASVLHQALSAVEPAPETLIAPALELDEGPRGLAAVLRAVEREAAAHELDAALVGGGGDEALAAVVSLVKLGIPTIRLSDPRSHRTPDLAALLADDEIALADSPASEVAASLRRILPDR